MNKALNTFNIFKIQLQFPFLISCFLSPFYFCFRADKEKRLYFLSSAPPHDSHISMLPGPYLLALFLALLVMVSESGSHFLSFHCYVALYTNGYRWAICCLFAAGFAALQAVLWSLFSSKPQESGQPFADCQQLFHGPVNMLLMPL